MSTVGALVEISFGLVALVWGIQIAFNYRGAGEDPVRASFEWWDRHPRTTRLFLWSGSPSRVRENSRFLFAFRVASGVMFTVGGGVLVVAGTLAALR